MAENIKKYAKLTGQKLVSVVYKTADGPVSHVTEKAISEGSSWLHIKT